MLLHCVSRWNVYILQKMTHGPSNIKLSASVIKTDKLMLYREIIAVCSQIHVKHINPSRWGVGGRRHAPAAVLPGKRPGMVGYGISRPNRNTVPGLPS